MKRLNLIFTVIAAGILVSCEKSPDGKSNTELITQASWKYESASIDSDNNGSGETPLPGGTLQSCQTDNLLILNANGTGTVDEGTTKCNAADPQTAALTWSFTTNETIINFNSPVFAGVGGDFRIISLTETQLVLSKQVTLPPIPLPITVIATFKH